MASFFVAIVSVLTGVVRTIDTYDWSLFFSCVYLAWSTIFGEFVGSHWISFVFSFFEFATIATGIVLGCMRAVYMRYAIQNPRIPTAVMINILFILYDYI